MYGLFVDYRARNGLAWKGLSYVFCDLRRVIDPSDV